MHAIDISSESDSDNEFLNRLLIRNSSQKKKKNTEELLPVQKENTWRIQINF